MAHTLTITEKGKPRGRIVFVPILGSPLEGRIDATGLDDDLETAFERIATIDEGGLWSLDGNYYAPLNLNDWREVEAGAAELGRRFRGLEMAWDSIPPQRLLEPDGPVPGDAVA